MAKKIRKNSACGVLLLYAVVWGWCFLCASGQGFYCFAEESLVDEESVISSLKDPFDLKEQVPELFKLFMKGLQDLKQKEVVLPRKDQGAQKPVQVKTAVVPPLPPAPVVPKIPSMAVTGLFYAGKDSQAIINGRVVGLGDVVDGVKIVGISKGRINVQYMAIDHAIYFSND